MQKVTKFVTAFFVVMSDSSANIMCQFIGDIGASCCLLYIVIYLMTRRVKFDHCCIYSHFIMLIHTC